MDFILGCNYWASHAGTEMWKNWDAATVKKDLEALSGYGMKYLRVFPNWRDFQPVIPLFGAEGRHSEYRLEGEKFPDNPYYLDETMLGHFQEFCDLCNQYGFRLIVGLLTGWMSGRLFIPPALYEKNIFSDPTALLFQQYFIKGFVSRFKNHPAIWAWDLGNECNCMSEAADQNTAENWTSLISNAIRAQDSTRPVISGMHSLGVENKWTIKGQAEHTDLLTTHPYPYWTPHCSVDPIDSIRALLHATCETVYYRTIGNKPCLVEETGAMGPMYCDNERAAAFLKVNLFSNWANGSSGVMWWCAHEQSHLTTPPYSWTMCERELGLLDKNKSPKPALLEFKAFSDWIQQLPFDLPPAQVDAVCILTNHQDHWGVAYMAYILAKQAGINLSFTYCTQPLPESKLYLLPSILGHTVMPKEIYDALKEKISKGAALFISYDGGMLTEFEELTGLHPIAAQTQFGGCESMELKNQTITFSRKRKMLLETQGAEVLAYDNSGMPAFTRHQYGQGSVYFLNFPLETMLLEESYAFDSNRHLIYQTMAELQMPDRPLFCPNPKVGLTLHPEGERLYAVVINYSAAGQKPNLKIHPSFQIVDCFRNTSEELPPFETAVLLLKKKS